MLAKLNLGMKEEVYLLKTWVFPCVFLAARAYHPDNMVIAELRKVYQAALSLSSWGITLECLARPEAEGDMHWHPPHVFLHWLHSGNFATALQDPHRFDAGALANFRRWAASIGLVLDPHFLRYLQLAPVQHSSMGFLAWSVKSFSLARADYQSLPPPLSYDNVLVTSKPGHTYYSPKLVRFGKLLYYHVFEDVGVHASIRKHVAPTCRGQYDLPGVAQRQPPQPVPKGEERWDLEDTWLKGWQNQAMLRCILAKRPRQV